MRIKGLPSDMTKHLAAHGNIQHSTSRCVPDSIRVCGQESAETALAGIEIRLTSLPPGRLERCHAAAIACMYGHVGLRSLHGAT